MRTLLGTALAAILLSAAVASANPTFNPAPAQDVAYARCLPPNAVGADHPLIRIIGFLRCRRG